MRDLHSVATATGSSALDGLVMGTRSGALDPCALIYLVQTEQLSLDDVAQMLYRDSGLRGISGISSEPHVIAQHEADPRERGGRAQLALRLYVRRIVRQIGALAAVRGGLDLLIFTAGIGEHRAFVPERVCKDLGLFGVGLSRAANVANAAVISSPASGVLVGVDPTNEEWMTAHHAQQRLHGRRDRAAQSAAVNPHGDRSVRVLGNGHDHSECGRQPKCPRDRKCLLRP